MVRDVFFVVFNFCFWLILFMSVIKLLLNLLLLFFCVMWLSCESVLVYVVAWRECVLNEILFKLMSYMGYDVDLFELIVV